ncbi:hypothetical protein [Paramagnetospirillum kuznetsovii]|nr:hypothetical protein [Paramagnetospirillum kuznetsovii]
MKAFLVLILTCLTLGACGGCEIDADNDEQHGRCWFFSKIL